MILVLAGTKDGRGIIEELRNKGYALMASTVSLYGNTLIEGLASENILNGQLDEKNLSQLIKAKDISLIIDATHPFAIKVSTIAIEISKLNNIPYIRYEREAAIVKEEEGIVFVNTFQEAAEYALALEGNVFLTVGSNTLEVFCQLIPGERIIARVLPTSSVLKKCEDLGLSPKNLVALQGPFSKELNLELFKRYQAGSIISKESGIVGGVDTKLEAAQELGLPLIIIRRPEIHYPLKVTSLAELLKEISNIC